ncbi:amino acid ABC transporter permease [Agrobacterium tumefaciens]|uniref:amino acid ABC transporter permease n=1 Tax=Agrobacterium tumefaciens TaxID=358 RepID=UPI001571B2D0|nr:amino acid ABC transporter permease [Agrobacterium tumefaciens]NSY99639.1 amino acid ABC transporter permease [Agrobacterium tumefaciens]NSZ36392.1 amino acid ABC transporter permease [Agrobacterium tumefaciens]NTB21908.1 amino acid ABC transporter permease [Agrobacterium tumefaciens]NTB31746.1 amino acid ABC transporter permease [Agrobacterium tumefaciens]NTB32227.1 amino acid ABC transporter permease [Agrobacterium tumefaciens]
MTPTVPLDLKNRIRQEKLREAIGKGPLGIGLTIIGIASVAWLGYLVLSWAVLDAVWAAPGPEACREAAGACWAVIGDKYRFILFANYPYEEQWRSLLACVLLLVLLFVTMMPVFWRPALVWAWVLAAIVSVVLLGGGVFGLTEVSTLKWGGLPITLLLFTGTILFGLPLAVLMALGRRSRIAAIRISATVYIETIRGIPLVNVLFMGSLLLPLILPPEWKINELIRAQIALIVFFGAYSAEVVRAGFSALPRSQNEAALAFGVSAWDRIMRIELPQALRYAMPSLTNDFIRTFKNTSLLAVIGVIDIVASANIASQDPDWSRYYVEVYLCVAALYFVVCFTLSIFGTRLEKTMAKGR